ncbi:MAG: tRNA (guanosine(46)-N7)-methyltransferase TrmB [Clostridia bacterium]|nr:tRNA (guanosine(46)-N7)-methyltransferase TrmB [Clostridia bacterium]
MRKKKNRDARLARVAPLMVLREESEPGAVLLNESFEQTGDLYLEIGCGKGTFACETAKRTLSSNVRLLAVEMNIDAMLMAMEKCASEGCANLKFLNLNAELLPSVLPPHSVARLFLNFSDPWPRNRDRNRRLTSERFLKVYRELLAPGADIRFKTDNRDLFDFSVRSLQDNGFVIQDITYDLHASEWNEGNIVTEYEKKWSDQGYPIHYLRASLAQ